MCNSSAGNESNIAAAVPSKSSRVTWQSNFESLTGKKPSELGFKTEAEANAYLLAKAQSRSPDTVLTGYSGSLTTH